jgi:hypothetical protein
MLAGYILSQSGERLRAEFSGYHHFTKAMLSNIT